MQTDLDLLYGLWTIAQSAPSKCAEILLTYRDVSRGCKSAIEALADVAEQLKTVEKAGENITGLITAIKGWKQEIKGLDEETFLNRMNRLCELAERIEKVKRNGSLKTLKSLIEE
jgi:hypothetical protein